MKKKYFAKAISLIFLVLVSIPYFTHISQDLGWVVSWDEAVMHINAKDIVLFGISSLEGERLYCIIHPLNALVGLVSFSFLGVSLFSLRLPYIFLNVLGNILFFDLIRRTRGIVVAMLTTVAFAFYAPRIIIGKGAMAESLILPLILILLWCFMYVKRATRLYFWIGILGMLITWSKWDNVFVLVFLTALAGTDCLASWRSGDSLRARKVLGFYLSGAALVAVLWLIFYCIVGWKNVLFYYSWIFSQHLRQSPWAPVKAAPFTARLFLANIHRLYRDYPGFCMASMFCLVPFLFLQIRLKRERTGPLSLTIYLLLFLLIGKLAISGFLWNRRVAPCYPLPFLLMANVAGLLAFSPSMSHFWKQSMKSKVIVLAKVVAACVFVLALTYVCYMPDALKRSAAILFSPTYETVREARRIDSILDKRYKVIYFDGRYTYLALQLPTKFVDIPPDLEEKEFYQMETNPILARRVISGRPDIGYALFRPDNLVLKRMIEDDFNGKLIGVDVNRFGVLYWLPPRNGSQ